MVLGCISLCQALCPCWSGGWLSACTISRPDKPGHCEPALCVLVKLIWFCLIGLGPVSWPKVGPVITGLVHLFGMELCQILGLDPGQILAHQNQSCLRHMCSFWSVNSLASIGLCLGFHFKLSGLWAITLGFDPVFNHWMLFCHVHMLQLYISTIILYCILFESCCNVVSQILASQIFFHIAWVIVQCGNFKF